MKSILLLLIIVNITFALGFINFLPYSYNDQKCENQITGYGFGLPTGQCVGNNDLIDEPGSYMAEYINQTAVYLTTFINIEYGNDCSGNPTSSYTYSTNGECQYDSYDGSWDETDYRYEVYNHTDYLELLPSNSILYEVYTNHCDDLVSYYFFTNGTTIGTKNTIQFTYYCDSTNTPQMYSCNDHNKCSSLNLSSDCNSVYKDSIKVSCTQ